MTKPPTSSAPGDSLLDEATKPWRAERRKRFLKRSAIIMLVFLVAYFGPPLPEQYEDFQHDLSLQLLDRNGKPLRTSLSARQGTDRWVPLEKMPPHLIEAVILAEDSRFRNHGGVDVLAVARAGYENVKAGRVLSGASTITQQLLRTLKTPPDRSWSTKLSEMYWATRLEWSTDKDTILEAYLNRVAFGPTIYGVEEASRYYFDKPASSLSVSEASLLAVLIRAPATFDPFSESGRKELRGWAVPLVERMAQSGAITTEAATLANNEGWELSTLPPPFLAPHFCDEAQRQLKGKRGDHRTTVDLELQTTVEGLVRTHMALLEHHRVTNCAVVVADVASGDILAMVGSPDYHRRADGQHNAAMSLRQPGSTLKPFTYALLLDELGHAGAVLPDLPIYEDSDEESFIPKNYDEKFHGPVSIRTALACSYNVPAVRALERVGVKNLLVKLRRLGMTDLDMPPEHYGLGLTLGDGSVSLLQLVAAYRCLADQGRWSDLTVLPREEQDTRQVLTLPATFLISHVLSDDEARIPSFGTPNVLEFDFPVAVKTGTSRGYRDNWTVGYTPKHVVGVWVGNSDGTPMVSASGITGAGPLFRDVMLNLGDGGDFGRAPGMMDISICSMSGMHANKGCPHKKKEWIIQGKYGPNCGVCRLDTVDSRSGEFATPHTPQQYQQTKMFYNFGPLYKSWAQEQGLATIPSVVEPSDEFRLVYPLDGDVFLVDPDLRNAYQRIRIRAVSGNPPYSWTVDDKTLDYANKLTVFWTLELGQHKITITDAKGKSDSVIIEVKGKP